MKRSDMVKIIENLLDNKTNLDSTYTGDLAKDILTEIEKAGMLPPVSQLEGLGTKDCAWEKE